MAEGDLNVDSIITRLLEGKRTWCYLFSPYFPLYKHGKSNIFVFSARGRPGKSVQLAESEVRGLCLKSREIFLNQPILLELEAPLKICGKVAS